MENQTAVSWLIEQIYSTHGVKVHIDLIERGNQMFEEQIKSAYLTGYLEEIPNPSKSKYYEMGAEQYYNETFKK